MYEYVKDGVVGKMFGCVIMRGCLSVCLGVFVCLLVREGLREKYVWVWVFLCM